MGAIVHGYKTYCFVSYPPITKSDTNLNCEILRRILLDLRKMPKKLYVQADNGGAMKTWTMLRFLSWLAGKGIVPEIELSMLIVGHTHEDIDQFFSVISRVLDQQNAYTPQEFMELLKTAHKDPSWQPQVSTLFTKFDYESWLKDEMHGDESDWYGIAEPHSFSLLRDEVC